MATATATATTTTKAAARISDNCRASLTKRDDEEARKNYFSIRKSEQDDILAFGPCAAKAVTRSHMMTMPLATVLLFLIIASMVVTAVTTIVNAQISTIKPASNNDMLFEDGAFINFSAVY
jgi:hypothetical protein